MSEFIEGWRDSPKKEILPPPKKTVTHLINAAMNGNVSLLDECLQAGIDINAQNAAKDCALGIAISYDKIDIALHLIELGAKVNIRDSAGRTNLERAKGWNKDALIPPLKDLQSLQQTPEWSLFSSTKLAHVEGSLADRRKLTEIFNFESRERLTIVENLRTNTESTLPLTSFDELPESLLKKAFTQFTQLGGVADESFVLHGTRYLDKSPSPLQAKRN